MIRTVNSIWLASLVCFSFLEATVNVTSSADSGVGSLRQAVEDINNTLTTLATSPISLDPGVNPFLTTNMTASTVSASIVATDLSSHTIFANGNVALIVGGSTVVVSTSSDIMFSSAGLVISEGTLQFNGANNLPGVSNVQFAGVAPTLQFSGTASGSFPAILDLFGDKNILKIDPTLSVTMTGAITGGLLEKQGTGILILPGANIYGGGTNIAKGTIQVANNTSLGSGPVTMFSDSILVLSDGLVVSNLIGLKGLPQTISVPVGVATLGGVLSDLGSLIVSGPGQLILTGLNTYTGTTSIVSGTLALSGHAASLQYSAGVAIAAGATLDISAMTSGTSIQTLSGAGFVVLGEETLIVDQVLTDSFSGVIGVGGTSGGLTLTGNSTGALNLSGTNLYTGPTAIKGGTLALAGASGSIESSSSVSVTGTFDISAIATATLIHNLSGSGNVILGAKQLSVVQTTLGTLSGIISGSGGSLILDAAATKTLTLSGVNTYTGPTEINGGTLALSGSGSISLSSPLIVDGIFDIHQVSSVAAVKNLSGSGLVVLGQKTILIEQTISTTFSGEINGDFGGGVTLGEFSTNTLTLTGLNTYLGPTQILAGKLALDGSGSIEKTSALVVLGDFDISGVISTAVVGSLSGSGNVFLGSKALSVIQSESGLFSGVISGSGDFGLDINSLSTLTLSGTNTYTGSTSIHEGVLALSLLGSITDSSSVLVSGILDISDVFMDTSINNLSGVGYIVLGDKTLTIDQSVSDVFSGMILGTAGSIIKTGSGVLSLLGSSSYGGLTTILDGTLEGRATSFPTDIQNEALLVFKRDVFDIYSHSITGSGSVEVEGLGVLVLSGDSTYTGPTTVKEGVLLVNGSIITSDFTVEDGAVLGGSGFTGSIAVYGGLKPGNSSGILSVNGDVNLYTGSAYVVSVDANGVSDLIVSGIIDIEPGVPLNLELLPGFLNSIDSLVPIMQDNTINGVFSAVATGSSWVSAEVSYLPDGVYLSMSVRPFSDLGLRGNSLSVGNAIDTTVSSGNSELNSIAESLFLLPDDEINSALNQMHPALFKGLIVAQENNIVKIQSSLGVRMENELDIIHCPAACSKEKQPFHLWMDSFGDNLQQKETTYASSPQAGYQNNTLGVVLGFDTHFSKYFYAGALGGYTNSNMHWSHDLGKVEMRTGYGGLYFTFLKDQFYVNTSVIGSWGHYNGYRNIRYSDISETATSERGNIQLLSHLDTGFNFGFSSFTIRPFDSLDYIVQKENGYREQGAGPYNLKVKESNSILLRNELGLQLSGCLAAWTSRWSLAPKFSWVREMRFKGAHYTSQFVGTNTSFTVTGYFPSRNLFSPGVLLSGQFCRDHLVMDLYYVGEFGGGYSDHTYGGQLRFGF